jgi:hypothetical protein
MSTTNPLINKAPTTGSVPTSTYENNPFFVATSGLDLLFKKAQSVGILLAIFAGLSVLLSLPNWFSPSQSQPSGTPTASDKTDADAFFNGLAQIPLETWLLVAFIVTVILLIAIAINIVIKGIIDYTAARLATGKTATISQAFRAVLKNFWGYTWVRVIVGVKTFLWTLLFIIPGFIMSVRYSLAGVAYFDKTLKGNGSVKESLALTKGGWLTTFASQNLLNLLTLGIIPALLTPGTNAVLYRQFSVGEKPKAHVLSWLTLVLPLIFGFLFLSLIIFLLWALVNYSHAV